MASTTFVDRQTPIMASWLNDVNGVVYNNYAVNVKTYGAVGNGTTNDTAAIQDAINSNPGKVIYFPKGTYLISFSESTALSVSTGTTLVGDGKSSTILTFVPNSTSYRNLLGVGTNVTIKNLKMLFSPPSNGSGAFFNGSHSGLVLDSCYFDGGITNSSSTLSHSAYGINFSTTEAANNITVTNCDVTRFLYFFLKTNTSTSAQKHISVSNCDFFNGYGEDCSFNSPLGTMDDIQVYACRFRDSMATTVSRTGLYVAFASCTNFRVGLCDFQGSITDAIHIEEASYGGTISNNTFYISGNGIVIQDNNISGTSLVPSNITVTGNSIRKSGTAKSLGKYGVWLVYDATAEFPARRTVVSGNTIQSFYVGIESAAAADDTCVISNNIAYNCATGFYFAVGQALANDNTSSFCDVGVVCDTSSFVTRHKFMECTIQVDAINRPAHLIDPLFTWSAFDISSGSTINKATLALGANDRVYGEWASSVFCTTPFDVANKRDFTSWDGTTWTRTNRIVYQPGAITVDVNNTGNVMNVSIYAAANKTNVRVAAQLTGSVVIAV